MSADGEQGGVIQADRDAAAQSYAFRCGLSDGRRDRLDGWANSSRAYRAGQVMSRVEREMTA